MTEKMGQTNIAEFGTRSYQVELLPASETVGWQIGSIDPGIKSDAELLQIAEYSAQSVVPVAANQLCYSDCTDGRLRMHLDDGETLVPVREKLVGADTVIAFVMAESLGVRFYGNDKATALERVAEVSDFLISNKLKPATHGACTAAGSFVLVNENSTKFAANPVFRNRIQRFAPPYEDRILDSVVAKVNDRLSSGAYQGYSDALVTDAVSRTSGPEGIAHYADTGRGVHGHEETAIVRLQNYQGYAIDTNMLAGRMNGGQVFSVNDNRIEQLASLFGRGHDDDYVTAYVAGELFTSAGHGSLGKNLRTIVIRPS